MHTYYIHTQTHSHTNIYSVCVYITVHKPNVEVYYELAVEGL